MCRHLAYLGPSASLRSLLIDPPHSLYRQAWAPRLQRHGTVNADGFGVGWYAAGDPVPARYRRAVPVWGDLSLPDIARVTRSGAVLAAVRSATEGTALGEAAAAPFGAGPWLFSHNGLLDGWPGAAAVVAGRVSAAADVSAADQAGGAPATGPQPPVSAAALLSLEAMVDSAFLWALVLERLRAGSVLGAALSGTIAAVEAAGGTGRFNFLLTDGRSVAATACGDTLWYRRGEAVNVPASLTVASEPSDDEPGWTEVPDRHLLVATADKVSVQPLAAGARPAPADYTPGYCTPAGTGTGQPARASLARALATDSARIPSIESDVTKGSSPVDYSPP
jgi:glutamine amidotransferase